MQILIDADACPVKDETYEVAARHGVAVVVVSNSAIRVPVTPLITRKVVSDGFDAADDWIVEHTAPGTVVISADILLADRCLKLGATVIAEGIQTPEESDSLVSLGVRFGQGYFYGRPQDPYLTRGQTRPKA